jgi:hypothetical protein
MPKLWLALVALISWQPGCGPDDPAPGSIQAALQVPRLLADDLSSVEVTVYEIDADRRPSQAELLAEDPPGTGRYEAYKRYNPYKRVTIAFQTSQEALIQGLPDRGPKWMFYARGLDSNPLLIAHGATAGPVRISSDSDTPTQVTITLSAIEP